MSVITVDFSEVEDYPEPLPSGWWRAKVAAVREQQGRQYPGLKITWESVQVGTEGQRADMFVSLAPQALWKLKQLLEALGVAVPKGAMRLDTDALVGHQAVVHVREETWVDNEGITHTTSKVDAVKLLSNRVNADRAPATSRAVVSDAADDDILF